ncbi:hypothetical protein SLEP1_g45862 [Rubroshorea leprosula]|uniref:Reverse transcriptase Ty1/copia-type domain-containing protein n=1 Tax=Rubroshorea leprosula TaxID=152421 RepID=A0AAV5LM46_9ROSI|nr:hypothetical protein SLEP1_g45862 [Rubroshorea leprosula]
MVLLWLLNAVTKEIANSVVFMKTTRAAWLDFKERYSQHNAPHVFEIQRMRGSAPFKYFLNHLTQSSLPWLQVMCRGLILAIDRLYKPYYYVVTTNASTLSLPLPISNIDFPLMEHADSSSSPASPTNDIILHLASITTNPPPTPPIVPIPELRRSQRWTQIPSRFKDYHCFNVLTQSSSPTSAKLVTIRVLLAIAAMKQWSLHQLDVQNAFLHGDLHEEVYMSLPPGHPRKGEHGLVCSSPQLINQVKEFLFSQFCLKDLGPLKYFLGIEVASSPQGLYLSQRKHTIELLNDARLLGSQIVDTLMEQNLKLLPSDGSLLIDGSMYRCLIGHLIYLTITRPDISFTVNTLSQFLQSPQKCHLDAAHRLLRYLKKTPSQGILLSSKGSLQLTAFCDSDWASCLTT